MEHVLTSKQRFYQFTQALLGMFVSLLMDLSIFSGGVMIKSKFKSKTILRFSRKAIPDMTSSVLATDLFNSGKIKMKSVSSQKSLVTLEGEVQQVLIPADLGKSAAGTEQFAYLSKDKQTLLHYHSESTNAKSLKLTIYCGSVSEIQLEFDALRDDMRAEVKAFSESISSGNK